MGSSELHDDIQGYSRFIQGLSKLRKGGKRDMKKRIRLHTGIYVQVEKSKIMTSEQWHREGERRFGVELLNWRYVCPMCGHIACGRDFEAIGVSPMNGAMECIGRYYRRGRAVEGDSSGCNWTAAGLYGIPNGKGIVVVLNDGRAFECFDFA